MELEGKFMVILWEFVVEQFKEFRNLGFYFNLLFEYRNFLDNGEVNEEYIDLYFRVNIFVLGIKFWLGRYFRWFLIVYVSIGMGENFLLYF